LHEVGPAHLRGFTVGVYLFNEKIGEGFGYSRQLAEQNAAEMALLNNEWIKKLK
jgi:dsRNA-specific ribonuclease